VQQGRVILHPVTAMPMFDDDAILRATQVILRVKDARAKLTGIYAPTKSQVSVITEDAVDAEIRRLSDTIQNRSAARQAAGTAAPEAPPS
jgi:hypothetical protein